MATTTAAGRVFFALGAFLTTSIYQHHNNKNRNDPEQKNNDGLIAVEAVVGKDQELSPELLPLEGSSQHGSSNKKEKKKKPDKKKQPSNAASIYTKAALADQIHDDLPGLSYTPNFYQFSGYLDPVPTRHVFYWYVESQSNPETDPVVLWTNGGPGCSGLLGFGTEHGPFFIDGEGILTPNEYSWNKIANMLYIEQPAGVGFSYTDTKEDKITGDAQAASDNYNLILQFLKKFPERKSNPFYIASESYGGHYMPQLALQILQNDPNGKLINFKGMMVGNPYVDPYTNTKTQIRTYYNHGFIAKPLFDEWVENCEDRYKYESDECSELSSDMFDQFGPGINPYALDYPVCFEKVFRDEEEERRIRGRIPGNRLLKSKKHQDDDDDNVSDDNDDDDPPTTFSSQVHAFFKKTRKNNESPNFLPTQDDYKPCGQVHLERYLNRHDIRTALHIMDNSSYMWSPCDDIIEYSDEDFETSVIDLYSELLRLAQTRSDDGNYLHNLNMLIFLGDDDSIASTAGTQSWIWDLGFTPIKGKMWKPWAAENQTAGFVTHFDVTGDTKSTFIFATVHGAGHEVPAYRPLEALMLFAKYLDRTL
jgi:carboxypeptidase C (cathepsin A)